MNQLRFGDLSSTWAFRQASVRTFRFCEAEILVRRESWAAKMISATPRVGRRWPFASSTLRPLVRGRHAADGTYLAYVPSAIYFGGLQRYRSRHDLRPRAFDAHSSILRTLSRLERVPSIPIRREIS